MSFMPTVTADYAFTLSITAQEQALRDSLSNISTTVARAIEDGETSCCVKVPVWAHTGTPLIVEVVAGLSNMGYRARVTTEVEYDTKRAYKRFLISWASRRGCQES